MGKGEDWKDSETECLIAIWRDPHVQQTLNNSKRNIHVYQQISETLGKVYGIDRSGESCRSKVKNMKSWYKREKDRRSTLPDGSDLCKDTSLFLLMEEVLHGDPTPPGSRQLFPTGLVSNLNKRDSELTSDQDGFHIKTEVFSDSDSEMDSLEISEEKNEHFSSNNGRQKNTVEGTNQGETTPSHLDLQESNVHGEENDIFNSENNAAKHNMKIPNTSKVNNTCDLEVSNSQKEQRLKMCSPAQNKKHMQTFQMKPEMRLLHGRNRQMNGTGVQSKTMGTTTFYHTLRRQARKNLMSRWLNVNVANNRQRLITKNSNRIQQVEPKDSDFAHNMNQNNFEQLYNSGENGAESFERLPVSKDSPKNSPDEQNTFVSIANKLTDMLEKLVESERQHLLVRQKEADVELQRQHNERERISNEKLRITMEETQRREDREHHYKVMQLILGRTVGDGISSVLTDKKT